jgi:hypothetical protein
MFHANGPVATEWPPSSPTCIAKVLKRVTPFTIAVQSDLRGE